MDVLVSVIIPVFNSEAFLDVCLESVVSQKFRDWECLLIDDGSTDSSGEICDLWKDKDSRFKVIHQNNAGVSAARNRGLGLARGSFITFIDSDDWVDENYLDYLVREYSESLAEIIVSGITYVAIDGSNKTVSSSSSLSLDLSDSSTKSVRLFLDIIGLVYGPTAILYPRHIILDNDIRFPLDRSLGEDIIFNFMYLGCINHARISPESHYYYRERPNSLVSAEYPNRFIIHYYDWQYQKSFLLSRGFWNEDAQELFAIKLWGIVYEGLFMAKDRSFSRVRDIMSIEDFSLLTTYQHRFNCAPWLKWIILSRNPLLVWPVVVFLKLIK